MVQERRQSPVQRLALVAIILLAGCAATTPQTRGVEPKITRLEKERATIAEREQQCIENTLKYSRDEVAQVTATSDASVDLLIQEANNERERELSECRSEAYRQNAESSERERDEYALQAQGEHDRASLIATLATSRPH
jgi:type IV pilus biogenesis protein CpaD/CtpE